MTRHPFRIAQDQYATLRDVIAVLELRIGVETEAAALAAQRRTARNLADMRAALDTFNAALEEGRDAVGADFQFHLEIARATQNAHFADLMATLGVMIIPRSRLARPAALEPDDRGPYLRRVNAEHESIFDAIASQDPDAARARHAHPPRQQPRAAAPGQPRCGGSGEPLTAPSQRHVAESPWRPARVGVDTYRVPLETRAA